MLLPKTMSADAVAENKACEAVVSEFKAILVQNGIAPPIVKLCDELAGRIALRRLLCPTPTEDEK